MKAMIKFVTLCSVLTLCALSMRGAVSTSGGRILGNASEGAVVHRIDADAINGNRYQALRNMRITSVNAKVTELQAGGSYKCAVYSDNNGAADHLLGGTAAATNPSPGWQSLTLTPSLDLTAGAFYWLFVWSDTAGARVYADNGGPSNAASYPFGDWPDPIALTDTNTLTFCLYAEGTPLGVTGPEMDVQGRLLEIADGASSPSAANGTDFGNATAKKDTRETAFTIYNAGQGNLELTGNPKVSIAGAQAADFSVTVQPAASVPAGSSTTFSIRFSPSAIGTRQATVSIPHGDSPTNAWDFAIQGLGLGGGAGVLGHDSDGTFARNIDDAQIHGNRFQAPVDMRISELHARVLDLAGTFKCAVYSDTNGWAGHLLRSSVEVVNATNGWNTFALTAPLDVNGGDYYWLVIWADTAGARVQADPVGAAEFGSYAYADLGGQWPDPIDLTDSEFPDNSSRTYCIYGEGTPIGTAPGPELDLRSNGKLIVSGDSTPSILDGTDFGSWDVQSGAQNQTFTIQNPGDAPLHLSGTPPVSVTGPNAADFVVTTAPTSPVPPGGTSTFTVRFDPLSRGLRTATVSVSSDDADENPFVFAVQGAGFITGRETIWPDTKIGKDVDFDGTYYELGTIFQSSVPGQIIQLRVFSLASESGDHTARIWHNDDETVVGGPYTWNYGGVTGWITFDIPPVNIDANTDYTVSISTGTSAKRNYPNQADLAIAGSNGQHLSYPADAGVFTDVQDARPTQSFNHGDYLRDVVFVPAGTVLDLPGIDVRGNNTSITNGDTSPGSADNTDFGQATTGGGTVDRTFSIGNTGTAPLNLNGTPKIVISGPQASEFTVSAQPATPVAPSGTSSFTIRFAPASAGLRNATVTIPNDSDKNPFVFAITGTGAGAQTQLRIVEVTPDRTSGNIALRWEGGDPLFQVESAAKVQGPYQSLGSAQSARVFTNTGALKNATQSYYRIRQVSTLTTASCTNASAGAGFVNTSMSNQVGTFTVQFDATPSVAPLDSVMALSSGPQTAYSGFACLTRFSTSGNIDARNDASYAADNVIPYVANVQYSFRMVVNVPAHTYSVYVASGGNAEQTVGANYAFRTEQNAVANLNTWAVTVDAASAGTNTVCNFRFP